MRILYLTEAFPYPLTSGYLRHYYFIRELARRHAITLMSLVGPAFCEEHRQALASFTSAIHTFADETAGPRPRWLAVRAARKLKRLVREEPGIRQMRRLVREQVLRGRFDVVFYSSGMLTFPVFPAVRHLECVPMIADLCDATSRRLCATARSAPWATSVSLWIDYLQVRRIERRLIADAQRTLFASARDREALVARHAPRAAVVPNGVDLEYWKRASGAVGRNTVVFTGSMRYQPNCDAALRLIRDIHPALERQVPEVRTLIVGADPPDELVRAGDQFGVTVTGFVKDIRPYLEQATVFAAPLRFGAGIQNKLLEAMAMEVPVVASPLAAEGLRTEDGYTPPIEVATNDERFVRAIVEQLRQRSRSPRPAVEAREFVERHFTWSNSGQKLERILQEICHAASAADRQPALPSK